MALSQGYYEFLHGPIHDSRPELRAFDPVWEQLSPKEQSRILELLIERVDFDGENGEVSLILPIDRVSCVD